MKKTVIIFLITVIISGVSVSAQQAENRTNVIRQEEFMNAVLLKAPELVKEKLSIESSKINIKSADAQDDLIFSAGSNLYGKESDPLMSQSRLTETTGMNGSASMTKKFSATGTQITGAFNYDQSVSEYEVRPETEMYSPAVSLSVRQPLLNNFFGTIDRFSAKTAKIDYEISLLNYSVKEQQILDNYKVLYCQWIIYRQIAAYNAENVDNALQIYTQTQRKFNARLAENDDLQKSYSSLLNNRQSYENSRLQLSKIENEIYNVLGGKEMVPDNQYFDQVYTEAVETKYERINFEKTLNYKTMNMSLQKLLYSGEAAENKTLPNLDVIASVTQKDSAAVNEEAWDFDKREYSIGFQFTYKIGNNAAEAEQEKALNSLNVYKETIKETEINYAKSMDDTLIGIETYKKIIDYQEKNLAALRSSLATEQKKYSQARIPVSNVISTENSIASARSSLLNSKMILINYYLKYLSLTRE